MFHRLCRIFILVLYANLGHALPFGIAPTPGTTLPTSVIFGQQTYATYTVTNNTVSKRSGNFVRYLPLNVTQITNDSNIKNLCGSTFTLQPNHRPNDSCILKLLISGSVNAQDKNPAHHLFVCFPGGTTCAGTNYPLNVSVKTSQPLLVAAGAYISNSTWFMALSESTNGGNTWQNVNIPLPRQYTGAELFGMSCSQGLCAGVGNYQDNQNNEFAAAVTSTDNGKTWLQQTINLPSGYSQGQLNAVYCSGKICQAVGQCSDTNGVTQAMTAVSTNSGATWTAQGLIPPSSDNNWTLNGVTCHNGL